jgi:hypothetical protein
LLLFLNTPTNSSLAIFYSQYVTWICYSECQGNFFKAHPYSFKHMKICRTPLDYWSGKLKTLCLTTLNTHNRKISKPPAVIEPTIPPSQRPQSHFLENVATGIDNFIGVPVKNIEFQNLHTLYYFNYLCLQFWC